MMTVESRLMKLSSRILFISLMIALESCIAFAQGCKTKVEIKTFPDSLNIFLNSNFIGRGTVEIKLTKGKYVISAKESPIIWDAKTISDTLTITGCSHSDQFSGKDTSINFDFSKQVYLNTEPQDAYVYKSDSVIGFTPLIIPLSDDSLTLTKPGFLSKSFLVTSKYNDDIIKLNAISQPEHTNFFAGQVFKILVGSIVVLGAATAYFKLKADDRFSQYKNTGDQTFLNETRTNDLISGITLGALEINFGILMYYFLSD